MTDTIRSRHQPNAEGSWCQVCGASQDWPCDAELLARECDAEKKRADDADGLYIATASHLRIANARADEAEAKLAGVTNARNAHQTQNRRLINELDAERERADKAEAALETLTPTSVNWMHGQDQDEAEGYCYRCSRIWPCPTSEAARANKAEAALAEMRPLYAAAGDDAWQRCIERDAAEADATALRGALWMVHQAFRPGGHPDHIPWSIVDETLAAHEARITKRDTPAKQGDPDGR